MQIGGDRRFEEHIAPSSGSNSKPRMTPAEASGLPVDPEDGNDMFRPNVELSPSNAALYPE
jgi:hypothetical protein